MSAGTVRVRPVTVPDSESAALVVNDVVAGTFIQNQNSSRGTDFSTASTSFVTLLNVTITPTLASSLQIFATVNFSWVP